MRQVISSPNSLKAYFLKPYSSVVTQGERNHPSLETSKIRQDGTSSSYFLKKAYLLIEKLLLFRNVIKQSVLIIGSYFL